MKKLFLTFLFICLTAFTGNSYSQILEEGEELRYVVYYGFIELGEVTISVTGKEEKSGVVVYHSKASMKTYKGVPFINMNAVFESYMESNGKSIYSLIFKANEQKKDDLTITKYNFIYDSNQVEVFKEHRSVVEKNETVKINPNVRFQDGLSMFYEARLNSMNLGTYISPVFMNEQESTVKYYFASKTEEISLKKFKNDISAIRCNGEANFIGVFGLTGEFAGWFSNDPHRVPLKAQFNVIIGSVTLELVSYKKKGWEPPRA
jgi:hypothetical protein